MAVPLTADSAFVNPAGLAMTFSGTKITFNGQFVSNTYLDPNNEPQWNLATSVASQNYPYGFGIAIRPTHQERSTYQIAGQSATLENSTREIVFSGAKLFFHDKLSLGGSFILGHGIRSTSPTNSHIVFSPGFSFGALYQLPKRIFLASTVTTSMSYPKNLIQNSGIVTDFFQEAYSPWRTSFGAGWIPNRHFQIATAVDFIGVTQTAGLLSQQSTEIGTVPGFIPKIGLAYSFAEFSGFKAKVTFGSYLETARIANTAARLHFTAGLQLNPWIFYLGAGIDSSAPSYQNIIYAAGIDTLKVLEQLDLVPPLNRKFENSFFPNMNNMDDTGLSKPILTPGSEEWKHVRDNPDVPVDFIQVGKDLPGRLQQKIENAPQDIVNIGPSLIKNVKQVVKDTKEAVDQKKKKSKPKKKN